MPLGETTTQVIEPQDAPKAVTSRAESPSRLSTSMPTPSPAEEMRDKQEDRPVLLCCSCGHDSNSWSLECDNCEHPYCNGCKKFLNKLSQSDFSTYASPFWTDWVQSFPHPDQIPFKSHYLRNPRSYVSTLDRIKQIVYELSSVVEASNGLPSLNSCEPRASLQLDFLKKMNIPYIEPTDLVKSINCTVPVPTLFKGLVNARNRVFRVCQMILYMKAAGLLQDRVSILIREPASNPIAHLIPIMVNEIFRLASCLNECMLECMHIASTVVVIKSTIATASEACERFLLQLHCLPTKNPEIVGRAASERVEDLSSTRSKKNDDDLGDLQTRFKEQRLPVSDVSESWILTTQVLDLATVLYCGGHTFSVLKSGLSSPLGFLLSGEIQISSGYDCSPEHFDGCMKDFWNGNKLWIFKPKSFNAGPGAYHGVCEPATHLQTDIATLSDVWGTAQPLLLGQNPSPQIVQYSIGNGTIFPWNAEYANVTGQEGVRLCH